MLTNSSHMGNLSLSTRFYIHLQKPPLCLTETVIIQSETGETVYSIFFARSYHLPPLFLQIVINCDAKNGSEYYLNTERISITYYRTAKFPISQFSMIVTPLKIKTSKSSKSSCTNRFFFSLQECIQCVGLIVLPIRIVSIEVLFVIDFKIARIMLMKRIVNTVS